MEPTHNQQPYEPTPEELAWDKEFKEETVTHTAGSLLSDVSSMAMFAVRLPGAVVAATVPEETVRHSRAALRESFMAVRSLLAGVGDCIEEMLAEPEDTTGQTVQGPAGTWGSGRTANPAPVASTALRTLSSPKVKRIDVSETSPEPTDVPGDMP